MQLLGANAYLCICTRWGSLQLHDYMPHTHDDSIQPDMICVAQVKI